MHIQNKEHSFCASKSILQKKRIYCWYKLLESFQIKEWALPPIEWLFQGEFLLSSAGEFLHEFLPQSHIAIPSEHIYVFTTKSL